MDVLILEDDTSTRKFFTMILNDIPGIISIMDTSNGKEAINLAKHYHPDLVLLDIELTNDELNGIEVAKEIYGFDQEIYLVFVTAHSHYAVSSFVVHPYSYILKPINVEEFRTTVKEIADKVKTKKMKRNPTLVVRFGYKKDFILKDDIAFIEVCGKQAIIHAKSRQWTTYKNLGEISKQLSDDFIRVHRSFIVNTKQIASIKEVYDRTYEIELRDYAQKIPLSRKYYNKYKHCFT